MCGARNTAGGTFKTTETLEYLRNQLNLAPVRNTTLVDITIFDGDKNEAATLANAIAKAYKEYRLDRHTLQTSGGIKVLETEYQTEEEEIQTLRTNVDNLRNKLGINDTDPQSLTPSPTLSQEQLRSYNDEMMKGETEYNKFKEQYEQLRALPQEKLRDVLPSINPDTALSALLDKFHEAQQGYVTKTNDYSPAHPDSIRIQALMNEVDQQINARVSGIMISLENKLNTRKPRSTRCAGRVDAAIQKDQDEASRGQPYWQEKTKLANLMEYHRALAAKVESEKN